MQFHPDEDPYDKDTFLLEYVIKYKKIPNIEDRDDYGYEIGQIWYNIKKLK